MTLRSTSRGQHEHGAERESVNAQVALPTARHISGTTATPQDNGYRNRSNNTSSGGYGHSITVAAETVEATSNAWQ